MLFNVVEFQCYLNLSSLHSEYWVNEHEISVNNDNIYVILIVFSESKYIFVCQMYFSTGHILIIKTV